MERLKLVLISAVAISAVLLGDPSVVAAAEASPAQVSSRIQALSQALDRIGAALNEADRDLHVAEAAAVAHRKALQTAAARQQILGQTFAGRASAMYTIGEGSLLETMLGAQNLDEFVERASYIEHIRAREAAMLEELTALRRRAKAESAQLAHAVTSAASSRKALASRRAELFAKIRELQSLKNILSALGGGRSRAPSGFHCPVVGPRYVSNNFGDPRPGGPHTGDDIMADYGQGVVAVLPGKIVGTPYGSWIGVGIILRDVVGNEWWYAHMSREYVQVGQRVSAGELIGRVGCSGRCYGPHLHFEYHPHGGGPANPYRILSGAC